MGKKVKCPHCGESLGDGISTMQSALIDNVIANPGKPIADNALKAGYGKGKNRASASASGSAALVSPSSQAALAKRKSEKLDKALGLTKKAERGLERALDDMDDVPAQIRAQTFAGVLKVVADVQDKLGRDLGGAQTLVTEDDRAALEPRTLRLVCNGILKALRDPEGARQLYQRIVGRAQRRVWTSDGYVPAPMPELDDD